ncbi:hypothetical protein ASPWEDRAFT_172355 [Aspergillus wentii DTO 134E9]|uniref:SnoaL-like domain-containing protein n=1 Tax=Aspergillus wentii DTO 134E9 TaxID=1073089 RepID=A0A1L9RKV4_ASPWE|nr:uncharacterized protein ASPWEDRAFT_172355 [Aspergillus wentii DTO 134E9]KAI9924681.1 hypothetical protein MW887_006956 [Aspergillus wentii]OJJ35552.1 hypothetical protein ASPWEDRAFT_172355 [Aspergillus wentii DTO 134E9]
MSLSTLPATYFQAVDTRNIDLVISLFAPDATFTVVTANMTFTGTNEIRRMFTDFIANSKTLSHTITSLVVDEKAGKVATEQDYVGESVDGTRSALHNCNFFDVVDGRFTRVVVWMSGASPLK